MTDLYFFCNQIKFLAYLFILLILKLGASILGVPFYTNEEFNTEMAAIKRKPQFDSLDATDMAMEAVEADKFIPEETTVKISTITNRAGSFWYVELGCNGVHIDVYIDQLTKKVLKVYKD